MPSVSSEDSFGDDEHLEDYSVSADVSESESSHSDIPYWKYRNKGCFSSSASSSPDSSEHVPIVLPVIAGKHVLISPKSKEKQDTHVPVAEVELMKERFAKLLLGEDMSGGGKGVCTALAISNAITNLSATVFGELWKLEPMAPQKKALWRREMEWLLSVSDHIVELVPSTQQFPGGGTIEVMMTRQRSDLYTNLPILKKIDAMLLGILNGFANSEFYYIDRGKVRSGADESEGSNVCLASTMIFVRQEEKWWLPFLKVPPNGLSDDVRRRLQHCRESTDQILKAAMAINSSVLAEMEIPDAYLESLPKSGRSCLSEVLYHYITADQISPESLIDQLDLSSEHTTLETINGIEASAHIWWLKHLKRRSTGGKVKNSSHEFEKNRIRAQRADTLLKELRQCFPMLPQTTLDTSKIQYNKDVGQAILESYSRVMESLAFNIMARIDDVLHVDDATKQKAAVESSFFQCPRKVKT